MHRSFSLRARARARPSPQGRLTRVGYPIVILVISYFGKLSPILTARRPEPVQTRSSMFAKEHCAQKVTTYTAFKENRSFGEAMGQGTSRGWFPRAIHSKRKILRHMSTLLVLHLEQSSNQQCARESGTRCDDNDPQCRVPIHSRWGLGLINCKDAIPRANLDRAIRAYCGRGNSLAARSPLI
jgi:hypothetical protein